MCNHFWKVEGTQRLVIVLSVLLLVLHPGNETRVFVSLDAPPNCLDQLTEINSIKRSNKTPLVSDTPDKSNWFVSKEKGCPTLEFDCQINEQQPLFQPPKASSLPFLHPSSPSYLVHAPITINGNSDFLSQAASENWVGTGTEADPLIIEGYYFTNSSTSLVRIQHTTLYFRIQHCSFNGVNITSWGHSNLYLDNVRYGNIFNNTFFGGSTGVYLNDSTENCITHNTLTKNTQGILLTAHSAYNIIANNTLADHHEWGIYSYGSSCNSFLKNQISKSGKAGILIAIGQTNTLATNVVVNNTHGIVIGKWSRYNRILTNLIANNSGVGIDVFNIHSIWFNDIFSNTVVNNGGYGIYISGSIYDTRVNWNTFIGNNKDGGSQAYDDRSVNEHTMSTFLYNYWANWTSPDEDNDGFVDMPYSIDGGNHKDSYPLVARHYLSWPEILYPYEDRTYNGTIVIRWTSAIDSLGYSVSYNVAYSPNNGTTWTVLATDLVTTNYTWNTATVADGSKYQIKIRATSSTGLSIEVTSTGTFTISNFAVVPETIEFIVKNLIIGSTGAFIGLSTLYVLVYVLYPRMQHRRKLLSEKK
ncbi:MAG: NosD domain-containing protein [Promethearchaeota archaeon]